MPTTTDSLQPTSITTQIVAHIFPATPLANIAANLPHILAALAAANLTDKSMLLMALATIRAEAECFLPLTEEKSTYNTSPGGHPFDLYDHRHDLGNLAPPDGASFRGRGFVQLTGRANYTRYARELGLALAANDLATARRLVNGGSHGLDRFTSAFTIGSGLLT
jgi:peptidoglycan L-alanyl-D-glutamate endopeptidase CwlK